jgi:hypothetical protein
MNGNKFAAGQILKKPVEVVKGQILAGWAQKSPEPWSSLSVFFFIVFLDKKTMYKIRLQTHKRIEHELWTWWAPCILCNFNMVIYGDHASLS